MKLYVKLTRRSIPAVKPSTAEQSRAAQLEAQPGPESLDATQKVGSQAEALGKLIRQHTTSLSQVCAEGWGRCLLACKPPLLSMAA